MRKHNPLGSNESHEGVREGAWGQRSLGFRGFATGLLTVLSPSFRKANVDGRKENKLAYLDGLRGIAAFMVYCTHHTAFSHENEKRFNHAFGYKDGYIFACLPIVRLFFYGGAFAVAVFFAISGYVLSASPMRQFYKVREDPGLRLAVQIGVSCPRRWIRLYLPVLATTFIFMTSWHLFGIRSAMPLAPPQRSYVGEVIAWLDDFVQDSYVFDTTAGFRRSEYNRHLWTIAVEFRGSLIVYLTIFVYYAFGWGPAARFYGSLGLFSYFQFLVDGPDYALFVMGMLVCDLDLAFEHEPDQVPGMFQIRFFRQSKWISYVLFQAALYLGSAPGIAEASTLESEPGWAALAYLVPPTSSNARKYFCAISGSLCIIAIPRISWVRRFFELSPCQYLGKVSFGFYLVHGPVMWTVGDRLVAAVGRPRKTAKTRIPSWTGLLPISHEGPLGLELSAVLPHLILLPLTIWLAAIITKSIDAPSVKLAKRMFPSRFGRQEALEVREEREELLPQWEEQSTRLLTSGIDR